MNKEQYRPRLTKEEYQAILAMRGGWNPELSEYNTVLEHKTPAKVLVFDVETAPLRSYTWGLWKQNIQTSHIISDWFMLTWSAKWLFEDEVFSDRLTSKEALAEDDRRISHSIWKLIDEADIIIAHNANRFDVKKLNTRFLLNGLNPPMPYQVIDTLEHLRKRFSISSNRLDYVNELLGIGRKIDTGGFALWEGCMRGDALSLKKMEEYNIVDVEILEETYLRIRAWIKPHPNMGLFIEDNVEVCPACGSKELKFGGTPYRTAANSYETFRCEECGSVGRSRTSTHKHSTTRSIPR
ncbi:hypothetical protein LCGC14_1762000 [marine sediment metagenome]|uniref:YprB ribonuclease H-like domain-containing protein n=1 Tax=marine sediment metagenome TaxID=412755 RepID=A0A0F9K0D3_9ZZZZ